MIYLDTSVALAHLLAEDRNPPADIWSESLVSSRLLTYELWTRVHARKLHSSHGEAVRSLIDRLALLEMLPEVLERALARFPVPVRTLDALHLSSIEFLRGQSIEVQLASYDTRMLDAARKLKIQIYKL